jgi:hypothetical protein
MSVHTQVNDQLTITLGSTGFECQFITTTWRRPGSAAGATVQTACPDGVVSEPGEAVNGALTGEAFTDTTADGLWDMLDEAFAAGTEFDYVYTVFPGVEGQEVTFTGRAKVNSYPELTFSKPGLSRHQVDLAILTATKSRPAPAGG